MSSARTVSLLGLEYDTNFSTALYLRQLVVEANTSASLIHRLSFGMPNCIFKPLAHCLVMGKIMSAAQAAIPVRLNSDDKPYLSGILNDIDKAIKACQPGSSRSPRKRCK